LKIYTLNVNGFRGIERNNNKISNETRMRNLERFKGFVSSLRLDSTDVIVLQEIPHEMYDKSVRPWKCEMDELYKVFQDYFSNETSKYKIIQPIHLISSEQCTVAICCKDSKWKSMPEGKEKIIYDKKHSFGNKLIELEYSDCDDCDEKITLLGLHMNVATNEMWDMILDSERKNKHTFIVGDFNAYEYRGTMWNYPQRLRRLGFSSLISNNVITNFKDKSSIDNIYVDSGHDFKQGILIKVEQLTDFETDHGLCFIEFTRL